MWYKIIAKEKDNPDKVVKEHYIEALYPVTKDYLVEEWIDLGYVVTCSVEDPSKEWLQKEMEKMIDSVRYAEHRLDKVKKLWEKTIDKDQIGLTINENGMSFCEWVSKAGKNVPAGNCLIAWKACENPLEYKKIFEG